MGSPVIRCHKCQTAFEADPLRNIGTFWEPIYAGDCPNCSAENLATLQGFDVDRMIAGSLGPEKLTMPPVEKRVADNGVIEVWVQRYIKEHFRRMGFDDLKGPHGRGPDFELLFNGRWVIAEAEVYCRNYVKHKHHEDPRWASCEVLIVLESKEPASDIRPKLPKTIEHIDKAHFAEWFRPFAAEQFEAEEKEWPALRDFGIATFQHDILASEIRRRLGPDAIELGDDPAFEFISNWVRRHRLVEFKLSDVTPEAIDEFCRTYSKRLAGHRT